MNITITTKWDYLQWQNSDDLSESFQSDWNNTLLTKINYVSNLLKLSTDTITINQNLLSLLQSLTFFNVNNGVNKLGNKFSIIVDNTTPSNVIYVSKNGIDNIGQITIINKIVNND